MIVSKGEEQFVEWVYQDAHGGAAVLSIPLDIYLVFCRQAKTLEHLRVLCFHWPARQTANAARQRAA